MRNQKQTNTEQNKQKVEKKKKKETEKKGKEIIIKRKNLHRSTPKWEKKHTDSIVIMRLFMFQILKLTMKSKVIFPKEISPLAYAFPDCGGVLET